MKSPAEVMVVSQEPEALLTFREHMWDSFEKLWSDRVEPSRKLLEDFSASIKDRIKVERVYAVGLSKLTERMQPHLDKGIVPAPIEALVVNVRNRADQSAWLADQLEEDVQTTIDTMLVQHAEVCKRVHADGVKLMKQWQETKKTYDQLAAKYSQACSDAEECARECLEGVFLRPSERTKLATRSLILSRQATAAEREYYKGVQRLNSAIDSQLRQMGNVLQAVQKIQEKRGQCCKDSTHRIVVYETSWLRNLQYDLDPIIKTVEDNDPEEELQAYIRANKSPTPCPIASGPKGFWQLAASSNSSSRARATTSMVQHGEELFEERLNAVRPLLSQLFTPATDGSGGTPSEVGESTPPDKDLTELRRGLAEDHAPAHGAPSAAWSSCATHRAALCSALREALLGPGATPAPQEPVVERMSPVRLDASVFNAIVALFVKALDGCMQENDVWNGRDLMVLAPKVMSEVDGSMENILTKVFPHALWGQKAFWEEMLLVSIAEAHARVSVSRRADAPGSEHPEAAMTYFLQTYVYYMHLFGIKKEQATDSVSKTLHKHSHLLGNTADMYQELLTRGPPASMAPHGA
mmetsp:Transcript_30770/g.70563  ORF Transcript_30770/g.70563 Transcript_30770/m.70563 type:complete len:581 (-) Transcript_30770:234-1976(-)